MTFGISQQNLLSPSKNRTSLAIVTSRCNIEISSATLSAPLPVGLKSWPFGSDRNQHFSIVTRRIFRTKRPRPAGEPLSRALDNGPDRWTAILNQASDPSHRYQSHAKIAGDLSVAAAVQEHAHCLKSIGNCLQLTGAENVLQEVQAFLFGLQTRNACTNKANLASGSGGSAIPRAQ